MRCTASHAPNVFNPRIVKAISLDITDTVINHPDVPETYARCARSIGLPWAPSTDDLRDPFKSAFKTATLQYPCYGYSSAMTSRQWWRVVVRDTFSQAIASHFGVDHSNIDSNVGGIKPWCSEETFEYLFRKIYQCYCNPNLHNVLDDALELLQWLRRDSQNHRFPKYYNVGVITNAPMRTIESVLPMLGLDQYFDWFLCSHDIGYEKPSRNIFDSAHERVNHSFLLSNSYQSNGDVEIVKKEEILHIGDSFEEDFCGARAAGFQALYLDRDLTANEVNEIKKLDNRGISYPGRSDSDIERHRINSLRQVIHMLS